MLCGKKTSQTGSTSSILSHNTFNCEEKCCNDKKRIDRCESFLETCKELTEPQSMAKEPCPLDHAFALTVEISNLKDKNIEIKSELKAFSNRSKQFTVDLLDECKSDEEVAAVFDFEGDVGERNTKRQSKIIKTLEDAINANHKEFIAHRHVQQLLHSIVYENYPAKRFLSGLFLYALYTLTFPIWACVFLFWKECKISQLMSTPFGKFVGHTSQFCVFVALLVLSSLRNSHEPSVIEYLVFAFVLAMFLQQIQKIRRERCFYFHKWWNCVLSAMLLGFLASGLLWLIGSTTVGGWSAVELISFWEIAGHKILLMANSLFSISSVISVFYLGSLCQVNSEFGPLQLSTCRMFKDIAKFLTIFLGVFFAFTLGVRNLYSYNRSLQVEYFQKNGTHHDHREDELSTFSEAWQVMFWALFDQTNIEKFETTHSKFEITSKTGKFLFAVYLISAVLVGINMLIAMMNNSFEHVTDDKDALNWKMSRTAMWLEFARKEDDLLPPPYNILQLLFSICEKFLPKWKAKTTRSQNHDVDVKDTESKAEKAGKEHGNDADNNEIQVGLITNCSDNVCQGQGEKNEIMERIDHTQSAHSNTERKRSPILQEVIKRYLAKKNTKEPEENEQQENPHETNV